ncbi:MAG: PfkB family carbohydrate kinase [Gemmatimonadota bacterium]|nr:PfkB family carbohydrate kinase [Gemmatimonadota bacterium]
MSRALIARDRLAELLGAARGLRVAVIGDAMLDVYLRGEVDRVSPEAPVPVVRVGERRLALGGAANVAQNVAALGAVPALVAAVGRDAAAGHLRAHLERLGAPVDGLVEVERPTTTKTRVVARAQQLLRFDEETDADLGGDEAVRLRAAADAAIDAADAVVLEDYEKGVLTVPVIAAAIAGARARKLPIVVDPKTRHYPAFAGATIFKPNRRELQLSRGTQHDFDSDATLLAEADQLQVEALLLTLGEHGMALAQRGAKHVHRVPTTAREVYDVVGAGDTVTAYLAAMLAAGASALEAATIANYAAGVEVGKSGAATVSPDEVLAAYERHTRG